MEKVFIELAVEQLEKASSALQKINWEALDAASSNALRYAKTCIEDALDCLEED